MFCLFYTDETAVPRGESDALIIALSIGIMLTVITVAVLIYRRRKGNLSPNLAASRFWKYRYSNTVLGVDWRENEWVYSYVQ